MSVFFLQVRDWSSCEREILKDHSGSVAAAVARLRNIEPPVHEGAIVIRVLHHDPGILCLLNGWVCLLNGWLCLING